MVWFHVLPACDIFIPSFVFKEKNLAAKLIRCAIRQKLSCAGQKLTGI
jgi:hypothetical protein